MWEPWHFLYMCIESVSEHFVPCVAFILDVSLQ